MYKDKTLLHIYVKNIYTMHHTSNKTESTNYVLFGLWCQQYFSYIMVVSFIGGGNQSTRRKPPTCNKLLTNFIT